MDTNHHYWTRSKSKKNKSKNKINIEKSDTDNKKTPPLKKIDLTVKKEKSKKILNHKDIFRSLILSKTLNLFNESDSDDEDYEPIEGLPEEVIYMDEEKKYIKSLPEAVKEKIFNLEKKILDYNKSEIPQRFKILNSSLSIASKSLLIKKLDNFYMMEETDNEYGKLSQWVDNLAKIPFDCYSNSLKEIETKKTNIKDFLISTKQILDNSIYGHQEAKEQILQELSNKISNPKSISNCIAIEGPPGNGKTTLVKDGICKALNRPFSFIALGGAQNSDFLTGHDYTYEGSRPGRIVEILQESKIMDPVIYFDELDKISESSKGEEIANLLCHLTDSSQNMCFHDKYFSGIDFDLSRATFIFSYNDSSKINPILLDRMIKIKTVGFNHEDKIKISKNYLIPKICKSINFAEKDINFDKYSIEFIITEFTENEKGVRNLKRCLTDIISKINMLKLLYKIEKSKENKNISDILTFNIPNFSLPIKINNDIITNLLKKSNKDYTKLMMYS